MFSPQGNSKSAMFHPNLDKLVCLLTAGRIMDQNPLSFYHAASMTMTILELKIAPFNSLKGDMLYINRNGQSMIILRQV